MNFGSWETPGNELPSFHEKWLYSLQFSDLRYHLVKGAQSRYFELFWPCTKLPLNSGKKPENNSSVR